MSRFFFILFQHLVPQHLLSRLVGKLAHSTRPWLKQVFIRRFIRRYGVNMAEARQVNAEDYACFNDFFTRELKPGARPLAPGEDHILSPADGVVSAIGDIKAGQLLQAKAHTFSLTQLLGGDEARAAEFENGRFATIYLSPKDYHRVHMPVTGTLREMVFVPGKLFSVNQVTADNIEGLFARNERVVCIFDTAFGPMAMVLVGAMIVASIETVWAGTVAPGPQPVAVDYRGGQPAINLEKGEEMGRFKLGSTVILLFGPGVMQWREQLDGLTPVRMGESIGNKS